MKNIITIVLILIVPVITYMVMSKNSNDVTAIAQTNNMPSFITFTSTMCMDCKKMKSVIKEIQPDYSSKINFISINALDKNKKVNEYIKKYNVVLVPTMVFLDKNGNQVNKIEGFIPKEDLIKEIEATING